MQLNFIKNNQDTFEQLANAIESGDITLAHRIAHTLKGNGGQIKEQRLERAAEVVESSLKEGAIPVTCQTIITLEAELKSVLEKLKPILENQKKQDITTFLNDEDALEIFNKLEPLLRVGDADGMNFLPDLLHIKGTDELIDLIEQIDFVNAYHVLLELKKALEEN
jgi:HPt (histidine-containing phosphotransfer) domain-containing protein